MADWEKVGEAGVDSGTVWLGDPCYLTEDEAVTEPLSEDWGRVMLECSNFYLANGRAAIRGEVKPLLDATVSKGGVVVGSFGGDGSYPVYVKRSADGYVLAAMIVFDEDEEPTSQPPQGAGEGQSDG